MVASGGTRRPASLVAAPEDSGVIAVLPPGTSGGANAPEDGVPVDLGVDRHELAM